jgi:hypothetical protein
MAIFAIYFAICLLALIVRGHYRVPAACINEEPLEDNKKKSIIADRLECKCHYTNFLWDKTLFDKDNQTNLNVTAKNISGKLQFEPTALVRK